MENAIKNHKKEVSVIICAFNEVNHIEDAILGVQEVLEGFVDDYEIIIVNDGSQDKTGAVAERVAKDNSKVRVFHHDQNKGYGAALKKGFCLARKPYVSNFPGDNDVSPMVIRNLVNEMGRADVIFSYNEGVQSRPKMRVWLSKMAVIFLITQSVLVPTIRKAAASWPAI